MLKETRENIYHCTIMRGASAQWHKLVGHFRAHVGKSG
jgi:hypothetical protein